MGIKDSSTPPTEWCDWWTEVYQLTPAIAYGWVPAELTAAPDDPNPWFWHWCSQQDRWMAQATPDHALVSREPLHMEPSLLWPCCGTHGFVRAGEWISA
ncbi:hypothetical protein ABZU94_10320 [Streptomyces mirabilis]|uniref:hypothetical protein n=1 Tax=Streptomyces sp. NPDC005388 TaxID=3156717 RepID=UPI0033B0E4A1